MIEMQQTQSTVLVVNNVVDNSRHADVANPG